MPLPAAEYAPIATVEDEDGAEDGADAGIPPTVSKTHHGVALSARDKWVLVRPMLMKYMFPLCEYCCYFCPQRVTNELV